LTGKRQDNNGESVTHGYGKWAGHQGRWTGHHGKWTGQRGHWTGKHGQWTGSPRQHNHHNKEKRAPQFEHISHSANDLHTHSNRYSKKVMYTRKPKRSTKMKI